MSDLTERDDDYDIIEVRRFGLEEPIDYIKRCLHRRAIPVESDGEVVAHLCPLCDAQLPPFWRP